MSKKVPFVSNTPDDMHCVLAVFRMVHKYFLKKDISWKKIDKLMHVIPGKGTWTFVGEMELAKRGINVLNIEPVDYNLLYKEGVNYLKKIVGEETAKYYLERSNIATVLKYIPEYLQSVRHETRKATIGEVLKHLKKGNLVGAEVNSDILNNKSGFNLHFVLLYDFDSKHILLHDPGLPPINGRRITIKEFERCWNFPGSNGGITVFRQ